MYDKSKKYVVALGKSLTSKKGVISEGEPIIPKYFTGNGEATMTANIKKKYIVTEGQFKEQCHYKGVANPAGDGEEPEDIALPTPRVKTTEVVTQLAPPPVQSPEAEVRQGNTSKAVLEPEVDMPPKAVKAPEPPEAPKAVKAPKAGATRSKFKK